MAEKVKVSREVADFLQKCENGGDMNWEDAVLHEHIKIFENHHGNEEIEINPNALCMLKFSPFELARILVLGYEIEETPEERIAEKYRYWVNLNLVEGTQVFGEAVGFESGVLFVLKELGIKIKGINE